MSNLTPVLEPGESLFYLILQNKAILWSALVGLALLGLSMLLALFYSLRNLHYRLILPDVVDTPQADESGRSEVVDVGQLTETDVAPGKMSSLTAEASVPAVDIRDKDFPVLTKDLPEEVPDIDINDLVITSRLVAAELSLTHDEN